MDSNDIIILINTKIAMKKTLLTFVVTFLLITTSSAQFKIHQDGQVSLGTISGSWNNGMQVFPNGCVYFNSSATHDWHWVTLATPNAMKGKCWIVTYPNNKYDHRFFVTGDGYLWKRGSWRASDSNQQAEAESIENASSYFDEFTGIWYSPVDEENGAKSEHYRRAGVSAQDVQKILPEAVTADENGFLYVDYDTFTVLLIQAFKEQKEEIQILRKALENNGLLKP